MTAKSLDPWTRIINVHWKTGGTWLCMQGNEVIPGDTSDQGYYVEIRVHRGTDQGENDDWVAADGAAGGAIGESFDSSVHNVVRIFTSDLKSMLAANPPLDPEHPEPLVIEVRAGLTTNQPSDTFFPDIPINIRTYKGGEVNQDPLPGLPEHATNIPFPIETLIKNGGVLKSESGAEIGLGGLPRIPGSPDDNPPSGVLFAISIDRETLEIGV